MLVKIKSIKKIQNNSKRYDIETDKNHNFFANGILVHNSSLSIYYNNGQMGVCSRNLELELTDNSNYIKVFKQYDLENKLKDLDLNICIQAELVGEGIQGNIYKLTGHDMYVFNIYDIDNKQFLSIDEVTDICKQLGLKEVPRIYLSLDDTIKLEDYELKDLLNLANNRSRINYDVLREGIVFKAVNNQPLYKHSKDNYGKVREHFVNRRFSFKVINNEYLLKQK